MLAAMDPVLVQIGPVIIRWYGAMMALAILLGLWLSGRMAPRFGIPSEVVDRHGIPFILWLFVGARLGYVVSHPAPFLANPLEIVRIDHGGLASHGAIVAGLVYAWWLQRREGISLWSFTDLCSVWIPLANLLVRFGNFMNGELYGDRTSLPWGVVFPTAPDGPRHPLQLYEMLTSAVLFGLVLHWTDRRRYPGQVFWKTMVFLSGVRFLLDLLRSHDRVIGFLTLGQLAALVLLAFGVYVLISHRVPAGSGGTPEGETPTARGREG
ncbi:MAG: prolipoprotein diacylglyceryl transferase [Armatimonadota bacterium]|nr:prolipoprotein diacylglyceryl transferase [Armatimonadota bacterium]MDR7568333.1 prolipoprotein diacylglyceryl transferase [Armatimonadota bacterium]MDR7601946.1 prolipoprotein diacylglyceryl transferase [Armatimonadota bacterium]